MEDWQAKLKRIFWGSGKGLREAPPEAQIAYKKYTSDIKNMPWWKVLFFNSPHSPSVSYAIKDSLMFNGGILCIGIAVLEIGFLVTVGPKEWTHFHHSLIMAPFIDNTNNNTQKNLEWFHFFCGMELQHDRRTRMRPKSMESPPLHRYKDMKHTPTKGELLDVPILIQGRRHRSLNCFEEPSRTIILQELENNVRMEKHTLHTQEIQNDDSIAGIVKFAMEHEDPLVYSSKHLNRYTRKSKTSGDVKGKEKEPNFRMNVLILGNERGQGNIWKSMEQFVSDGKLKEYFQRPFLNVMIHELANAITTLQQIDESYSLSKFKNHVSIILETSKNLHKNIMYDLQKLSRSINTLSLDSKLMDTIRTSLLFHPNQQSILYLFKNVSRITSPSYIPTYDPEYQYFLQLAPNGPSWLSIVIKKRAFKFFWTNRIKGSISKWIEQFPLNDIIIYWADISSIFKIRKSLEELTLISKKIVAQSCIFIILSGYSMLIQNQETALQKFTKGRNTKTVLQDNFRIAAQPKRKEDVNPTFTIYFEFVENTDDSIDINSLVLDKVSELVEALAYFRLNSNV